jgi:hypothetical protein
MAPVIDLNELKDLVRGAIYVPSDGGYDEARQVWNGMIDRRPAAIVCAAGVADVMAALQFAGELGLPVAIRGGGHNVAGTSVGEGSIVVDLARFKSVRVGPVQRKARRRRSFVGRIRLRDAGLWARFAGWRHLHHRDRRPHPWWRLRLSVATLPKRWIDVNRGQ